jgi:hypothetical protein
MNKQPTRCRRASRVAARRLALSVAVAGLVALLGAGQALATLVPPDERVLERPRRYGHHAATGQAGEQGDAEQLSQGSPAGTSRRFIRPEPPMTPRPQLDAAGKVAADPAPTAAPDGGPGGLIVTVAVAALLLALGGAATWRIRHRRPRPEPTT